jgi:hypothetical protein
VFLIGNFVATKTALANTNKAVEDYLSATASIPLGSRMVRLQYPAPSVPGRYGYMGLGRDSLFHADAFAAARCDCIDLSDYQAPNGVFPIVFKQRFDHDMAFKLWTLEGPVGHGGATLSWLQANLPVSIQYIVVVADDTTPSAAPDYPKLIEQLDATSKLVATSRGGMSVRVYKTPAN